jgi:uncharacterized protein YegL
MQPRNPIISKKVLADLYETPNLVLQFLILDGSGSMAKENKAVILNQATPLLREKYAKPREDANIVVCVTLIQDDKVELVVPFVSGRDLTIPQIKPNGVTPLGQAVKLQVDLFREIQGYFQAHGKNLSSPVLTILSDGVPTDKYEDVLVELQPLLAGDSPAIVSIVGAIPPSNKAVLKKFVKPDGKVFEVTPTSIPAFLTAVSKTLVYSSSSGNTKAMEDAYAEALRTAQPAPGSTGDGVMRRKDLWAITPQDGTVVAKPGSILLADLL